MSDEKRLPPPFRFFVCDTCGEKMEASTGVVEWLDDGSSAVRDFRIVHAPPASITKPRCTKYVGKITAGHMPLHKASGNEGAAFVLARLSDMSLREPVDFDAFTGAETQFKRLSIPYFEEARQHFVEAEGDGYFDGRDPDDAMRQASLREIVQLYD